MKLVHRRSAFLGAAYLAGAVAAQADPTPLNVPILMRGSLGEDACPQRSRVIGTETDTVAVQGGPNTGFREGGQLHGAMPYSYASGSGLGSVSSMGPIRWAVGP